MLDGKLDTHLSLDDAEDTAEDSLRPGFSHTDFRNCSSTTSACSISYKHRTHLYELHLFPHIPFCAALVCTAR